MEHNSEYSEEIKAAQEANFKKTQDDLEKIRAYKETFTTGKGKIVLKDLMHSCGFMVSGQDGSIEFREGKRSIICQIIQILGMSEKDILDSLYENNKILSED